MGYIKVVHMPCGDHRVVINILVYHTGIICVNFEPLTHQLSYQLLVDKRLTLQKSIQDLVQFEIQHFFSLVIIGDIFTVSIVVA